MPYKMGEYYRNLKFWKRLTPAGLKHLVHVTEDMPFDRFGGLMHLYTTLWSKSRYVNALLLVARMGLNSYTSWVVGKVALTDLFFDGKMTIGGLTLENGKMKICEDDFHHAACITSNLSRLRSFQIISVIELLIVFTTLLIVLLSAIVFLLNLHCRKHPTLPSDRPMIFMLLPKFVAKLSAISFLQLLNFGRFRSIFLRGEGRFWFTLMWQSVKPSIERNKYIKHTHEDDGSASDCSSDDTDHEDDVGPPHPCARFMMFVGAIFYLMVVAMSCQAMLMKLTIISFAGLTSFDTWNVNEWVVVLGFLNQIAALCWLEEVEFHRLLLFKFGGPDALWGQRECHRCDMYFRFLAMKIITGKIGEKGKTFTGRLAVLCTLYTLNADDVQKLLLSTEREDLLKTENDGRIDYFQKMFAHADVYRKALHQYAATKAAGTKEAKEKAVRELLPAVDSRRQHLLKYENDQCQAENLGIAKLAKEQQVYLADSIAHLRKRHEEVADDEVSEEGPHLDPDDFLLSSDSEEDFEQHVQSLESSRMLAASRVA